MIKIYFLLISLLPFLFPTLADSSNCTIPNCITCSLDPSNLTCLQCDTGFYYDREQEICAYLFPCNEGEYKNETTGLCFQCSPDCESCIGPGSYECSTCPKGYYLVLMGGFLKCYTCSGQFCDGCDEVGNCISCPVGYWLDNTLGNCKPCNVANCRNCDSDLNGCDQCSFGFLYSNLTQTCNVNSNCQLGYYNNYLQSWACSACDHSCFNCFGGDKGSCYECASGYFFNNNSQCEQCNASCSSCDEDASYCVSCNSPLMLRGHECVTACAGDEYYDQFEMRCKSCDPSCGSCKYSATYCLDCADQVTQKLVNNTCVSICGPQKYAYLNLYHLENYLYQQYEQFIFDNDTVISQQGNGTNCQNCRSSCANCIFDSYYCTQCAPGMYLQLSNAQCSTSCPTGTYSRLDNSSNVSYCLDCPYP
jgi:proprotein convertase subtilisin/kexin type 5